MPAPASTDPPAEVDLREGELVIRGRMPWSSNATFLVELVDAGPDPVVEPDEPVQPGGPATGAEGPDDDGPDVGLSSGRLGVYKPHRGERPLWDFPDGLYRREAAAHELARCLGWDLIPETVVRDGPLGIGSVQRFVAAEFDEHYFTLLEDPSLHDQLRRMAVYDVVANSTDRKGGHVLVDADRHLWGIDNGLCLHQEPKLRTVIWDFGGEPLDRSLAEAIESLLDTGASPELAALIEPHEVAAMLDRARSLLTAGRLPTDPTGRRFPWPLV